MDLENKYYSSQLEAIQSFFHSLQGDQKDSISLTEAIVTWFTEGHAEKFREEYLRKDSAVFQ